ncbi:protein SIEVE ELEMENT OCCLUSION B-like [Senna tora]|uniref:Protein SIEVE ELEMENT OCCLUSION B-like n=1 Tax=Senna tora TaxID=362788 RepID=A0A834TJB3_9FABA|nr:protein SIEVE ELEMENT OCCLUSION B-like [Senna tora]
MVVSNSQACSGFSQTLQYTEEKGNQEYQSIRMTYDIPRFGNSFPLNRFVLSSIYDACCYEEKVALEEKIEENDEFHTECKLNYEIGSLCWFDVKFKVWKNERQISVYDPGGEVFVVPSTCLWKCPTQVLALENLGIRFCLGWIWYDDYLLVQNDEKLNIGENKALLLEGFDGVSMSMSHDKSLFRPKDENMSCISFPHNYKAYYHDFEKCIFHGRIYTYLGEVEAKAIHITEFYSLHMLWVCENLVFPFIHEREESLWKSQTWSLVILVDENHLTVLQCMSDLLSMCSLSKLFSRFLIDLGGSLLVCVNWTKFIVIKFNLEDKVDFEGEGIDMNKRAKPNMKSNSATEGKAKTTWVHYRVQFRKSREGQLLLGVFLQTRRGDSFLYTCQFSGI